MFQQPQEEDEEDANTEFKQHQGEGRKGREGTEEREVGGGGNPPWSGGNFPVQFPAGSLTSQCVYRCVCVFPAGLFKRGMWGGSFSPCCRWTARNTLRGIYI